jgi:hypothetical protein
MLMTDFGWFGWVGWVGLVRWFGSAVFCAMTTLVLAVIAKGGRVDASQYGTSSDISSEGEGFGFSQGFAEPLPVVGLDSGFTFADGVCLHRIDLDIRFLRQDARDLVFVGVDALLVLFDPDLDPARNELEHGDISHLLRDTRGDAQILDLLAADRHCLVA